eukprot:CAMPEP_0181398456 /NCGR_PEP_ID=MMETSP1110-20121109/1049_1 /TAXON_ID=174948 /ORGANISM="Symbiodinium sp., Strain CCMP421" /LENGTH=1129 /DNA_ID=CAMNT_0023520405 /DNA_START=59 /DNA_END=3448 /DNA_ORIENTATION=+
MGNLTQSQALRGSQARSLKTSERKLAGNAKMKLRLSRVEQLSDWVESLSPKNQGLLGFGTVVTFVSAGYLSSEAMEGEDNEGNSFTVDSWDEATWDATQVILQTTADVATNIQGLGKYAPLLGPAMATTLAVVDMFMPFEDDELTKDKVGVMIDEKLAKAKKEWMKEVLEETRGLIQDAVDANSLRETQLEIRKLTGDLYSAATLDFMGSDAALAYLMAVESSISHLADKLFLPCLHDGWHTTSCRDRVGAGAVTMFDALAGVHYGIFSEIFRNVNKKLQRLREHLFRFADVDPMLTNQTLVKNFNLIGCPNPNPSHADLEIFKALPYFVVMRHLDWGSVSSEVFYTYDAAASKFAEYNGGAYAAVLVDGHYGKPDYSNHYYGNQGAKEDFWNHFADTYKTCSPVAQWANVGLACSGCRGRVQADWYGGRCSRYCARIGHRCTAAAAVGSTGTCEVSSDKRCDEDITTSHMLCTCEARDPAPYFVLEHVNWGSVTDFAFHDINQAKTKFSQLNGGPKAAALVDARFNELDFYGNSNKDLILADFLQHIVTKYAPKETNVVRTMRGYCDAVDGGEGGEKARACCGLGKDTCAVQCANDANMVLDFDIYRKMQAKLKGVNSHYRYLLEQSLDKFLDVRLSKVLCDGVGCRDEGSLTHGSPEVLAGATAKEERQRELFGKSMGALVNVDMLTSSTKVWTMEDVDGDWSEVKFSTSQPKGYARIIAIVKHNKNTPILTINGARKGSPTCASPPAGKQLRCRGDNPQWDTDTSPLFWDFELEGNEVTIAREVLYYYGAGTPARGKFSVLMMRVQPTPHAWPGLVPVQNKFDLPSRGCSVVDDRYIRCTGTDSANGRDKSLVLELSHEHSMLLKWEVSFYMRLTGLGNSAAALQLVPEWASHHHGWNLDTSSGKLAFGSGSMTEKMPTPVKENTWHHYRIKRSQSKIWLEIDDRLVDYWKPNIAGGLNHLRIRPWRAVGSIWGLNVKVNRNRAIKVLNTWHDATQTQGKYFNFNADDIDLDVNDGDINYFWPRHCQYPTWTATADGREYHLKEQTNKKCGEPWRSVRIWQTAGTTRGGNAHGRLAANYEYPDVTFGDGDLLILDHNALCPLKWSTKQPLVLDWTSSDICQPLYGR